MRACVCVLLPFRTGRVRQKCRKDREEWRKGTQAKKEGIGELKGLVFAGNKRGWVGQTEMEVEHGREVSPERKQNGGFWKAGKADAHFSNFTLGCL